MKTKIPDVAWRHVEIECGRVARIFHLNEDDREDLISHISCEVRKAVAKKYDIARSKVYTFVQRVVRNQLCKWMRDETTRRNDLVSLAMAKAEKAAKKRMTIPSGVSESVDDTSGDNGERQPGSSQLPEEPFNSDVAWEAEFQRELMMMAAVRHTVSELRDEARKICELHLRCGTLYGTFERLRKRRRGRGLSSKTFYGVIWPTTRLEFVAKWTELGYWKK